VLMNYKLRCNVLQEEWEALGLEKKTDYENLRRVFDRISGRRKKVRILHQRHSCVTVILVKGTRKHYKLKNILECQHAP
jgi:hypothetical protein